MDKLTFEVSYASDLAAALELAVRSVDPPHCVGSARNWISEALKNTWTEQTSIAEWVARAVASVPVELRRGDE